MDQVLRHDVVEVILAALVEDVVQTAVVRDAAAVVDAFKLDAAVVVGGDVSDDVEDGEHRLLVVGLASERRIACVCKSEHGKESNATDHRDECKEREVDSEAASQRAR